MESKEYEQKRAECWEEYKESNLDGEVQWQPVSRYDVFCAAFDRAYQLGKQTETITQEEIVEAAKKYDSEHAYYNSNDVIECFVEGANFTLGKQERDAEGDNFMKTTQNPKPSNSGKLESQDVDKQFNNNLKDSFRNHNRLHVAGMALAGLLANPAWTERKATLAREDAANDNAEAAQILTKEIAEDALEFADELIKQVEKGGES